MGTRALGPGLRSVVWVQGCPFRCAGCIAPDWIPLAGGRRVPVTDLAAELLADPQVAGLTFSGGEPMLQAGPLADLARRARGERDLTLIVFTGFRLAELRRQPPGPGVPDLLGQADVVIDGRYVASRNDGRGLRGSDNQRVHLLTGRLAGSYAELVAGPRRTEIRLRPASALLVGVPAASAAHAFAAVTGDHQ